jgi:hypothetical protein
MKPTSASRIRPRRSRATEHRRLLSLEEEEGDGPLKRLHRQRSIAEAFDNRAQEGVCQFVDTYGFGGGDFPGGAA